MEPPCSLGLGLEFWKDVKESCQATIRTMQTTSPEKQAVSVYQQCYEQFKALYPALKPSFASMGFGSQAS